MGSSGFPTLFVIGRGNREGPSALAWAAVGRNWMSYEYADRMSAQLLKGEFPAWDPKVLSKVYGLSFKRVKCWP